MPKTSDHPSNMPLEHLMRADVMLVERGLAESRTHAQRLIGAGAAIADNEVVLKSALRLRSDADLIVTGAQSNYVSRGGDKLAFALKHFSEDISGAVCLDIGISTGGFTDCLLQSGARKVVGIDVGHGQLHHSLAADSRVCLKERINARYLKPDDLDEIFDLIVIDVSFISLTMILPAALPFLASTGAMICLIKPQFEVGPSGLGKNGIVTDVAKREKARETVHDFAAHIGLIIKDYVESPVKGGDGNTEYLSYMMHP
jgi:23S rRNA (cytidine1920-2'-O)/16S rRNA (cytidine1409-2'-O)-methyltransferase